MELLKDKGFLTILGILIIVISFLLYDDHKKEVDCKSKGGEYHSFRGGSLCVKPDAVIK